MSISMVTPDTDGLRHAAAALRAWQVDRAPMQLHPGDVGFHWRDGADATAAHLRVWSRDGRVVAVGMLDAPQLLRMAVDPDLQDDAGLVGRLVDDLGLPERGVLAAGPAVVEARCGAPLRAALVARGWQDDEPWTPLHLDLAAPVPDVALRVEEVGPDRADAWVAVHWSAFRTAPMTDDDRRTQRDRWLSMAASAPYADARCLLGLDADGAAVAVAGVWSAGAGRPGLLEPIGVHPDHRGHGHGRAITLAAAATLREMGASSATVCTPADRSGAVATYVAAGFERFDDLLDLARRA